MKEPCLALKLNLQNIRVNINWILVRSVICDEDIFHTCRKHLDDRIISLTGAVCALLISITLHALLKCSYQAMKV
jgi:hypothetical protein